MSRGGCHVDNRTIEDRRLLPVYPFCERLHWLLFFLRIFCSTAERYSLPPERSLGSEQKPLGVNDLISFASRAVKEMEGGDRPQAVDPCSERIPRMLSASCYKDRKGFTFAAR